MVHPWHDPELGKDCPEILTAVIEIPKGSNVKYKLDHETGLLRLGEFLPTVARYPANYGFFPRTLEPDGDGLDVFVFGREAIQPLAILDVRPLGGATTISKKKGVEHKIIAVCPDDEEFKRYKSIKDLPAYYINRLTEFFEEYKSLQGEKKKVREYFGRPQAHQIIKDSIKKYLKKCSKPPKGDAP